MERVMKLKARDVMSSDVACCSKSTSLQEVAKMMVDCDCGEIPVVDEVGRPVGVVTDRDIVCRAVARGRNTLELTARDCMSSPVTTVGSGASIDEVCGLLEQNRIRRVPVVDRDGRCVGIVSQADIARSASKRAAADVLRSVSEPTERASATAH
jgi:CBS domain-containing protein